MTLDPSIVSIKHLTKSEAKTYFPSHISKRVVVSLPTAPTPLHSTVLVITGGAEDEWCVLNPLMFRSFGVLFTAVLLCNLSVVL